MSEKKICPLMVHAIMTNPHVKPNEESIPASRCIGDRCQLWWLCSGDIACPLGKGDSLIQVGSIMDK